jgi:hypothetical protein
MEEGGLSGSGTNSVENRVNAENYVDPNIIDTERAMHFRYELNGTNSTYSLEIDNLEDAAGPVQFASNLPWQEFFNFETFQFEPAPGVNEISFLTDASAVSNSPEIQSSPDVFIDNLRVINNDLPPLPTETPGDLNGDDLVNFGDLSPFVKALTDIPGYEAMFPGLDRVARCDVSGDGLCNFGDLTPFANLLTGGPGIGAGMSAVPEPSCWCAIVGIFVSVITCLRRSRLAW